MTTKTIPTLSYERTVAVTFVSTSATLFRVLLLAWTEFRSTLAVNFASLVPTRFLVTRAFKTKIFEAACFALASATLESCFRRLDIAVRSLPRTTSFACHLCWMVKECFFGCCFFGCCFVGSCFLGSGFLGCCFVGSCFLGCCFVGSCFLGCCFLGCCFVGSGFLGSGLVVSGGVIDNLKLPDLHAGKFESVFLLFQNASLRATLFILRCCVGIKRFLRIVSGLFCLFVFVSNVSCFLVRCSFQFCDSDCFRRSNFVELEFLCNFQLLLCFFVFVAGIIVAAYCLIERALTGSQSLLRLFRLWFQCTTVLGLFLYVSGNKFFLGVRVGSVRWFHLFCLVIFRVGEASFPIFFRANRLLLNLTLQVLNVLRNGFSCILFVQTTTSNF